ncbi:MAG: flagellin modification protein A [Gammaproteobacteria bacterium]|nr:flagellin modification protein A [Gammaproteobacteria bacterium]MCH9744490.1 flagellin modification protein A [Gammaproteobacteria bacterium]
MNMKILQDKVVVVTGGCGLIGQSFVRSIVDYGGYAVIADIDDEAAAELVYQIGDHVCARQMDITSKDSIQNMLDELHKDLGRIDALVNNAYPRNSKFGRNFFDVEYEDFIDNLGMNLGGYFLTSQQFSKYFIAQGYGNIVNIASIYGVIAPRFELYKNTTMEMPIDYAAIKSALIHLTKYMAKYLKGKNIRVNCISPGGIYAEQPETFLDRYKHFCLNKGMLSGDDLTGALLYLLSDWSMCFNGQNMVVDDGFTL